ncbi:ankyrin repeat domain-containing protein [Streptomyces sp. NBC_00162]|uniref:ankyrin repeat domain-containing protein n=1 Tax=Streptomyces sp. NBC_00162 TaxID=2903629 RepID=UPI003A4C5045
MGSDASGASGAVDGSSPLMSAVRAGDTALVKRLLLQDSDSDVRDAAFCLAVGRYSGAIAQLLLHHGADPSRCGPGELLPLREAVDSGSPALVEALLYDTIRGGTASPSSWRRGISRAAGTRRASTPNCGASRAPGMLLSVPAFRTTSTTASTSTSSGG